MNTCECGCGALVNNRFKKGHYGHKFTKGHKTNIGTHPTEETKRKMGLAHKGKITYWKGGKSTDRGYNLIYKPDHPQCNNRKYIRENRLIWEENNKAMLLPWIIVHHKNGIKTDNRIDNLELMTRSQHMKHHRNNENLIVGKHITGLSAFV